MKTTTFNLNRAGKYLSMLALICCLFFNRAKAQWIPIDTVFAGILIGQNSGCVNNYKLDTVCAKNMWFGTLTIDYPEGNDSTALGSLEGLQYIGKNFEGSPVGARKIVVNAKAVDYIPDLPSIYATVDLQWLTYVSSAPYPGDSARIVRYNGSGVQNIPVMPPSVVNLSIEATAISSIPSPLPPNLLTLYTPWNSNLVALPDLPATLKTLTCHSCNIAALPILPDSLVELACGGNKITSLPSLPPTLRMLTCGGNLLTELPEITSTNLAVLQCGYNQISVLPELDHTSLTNLDCTHNRIKTLPRLPYSYIPTDVNTPSHSVYAAYNDLDSITNLPPTAYEIDLRGNKLTQIPPLGDTIIYLKLSNNRLASLPALPPNLYYLYIDSNPIACLPPLPNSLFRIYTNETLLTCFPNIPTALPAQYQLPVCTNYSQECSYAGITGRVFFDKNNNCTFDNEDVAFKSKLVRLSNGYYSITDTNGIYRFVLTPGSYSISLPKGNQAFSFNCPDSIQQLVYNGSDTITNIDFAVIVPNCAALLIDVSTPLIRVAVPNTHTVLVQNQGSVTSTNVEVKVKFEPELTPVSSIPAWNQQIGNTLMFNIDSVRPFQDVVITIIDSTSITALPGQTACVMASIKGSNTCALDTSAQWDGSHLEVRNSWQEGEDSISFFIKNLGTGMTGSTEYRIYEEELLMLKDHVQLAALDSLILKVNANGHTYRVEVDQRPFFPSLSMPRSFIEMAGTPPFSLHKILPIPQDDADEWV